MYLGWRDPRSHRCNFYSPCATGHTGKKYMPTELIFLVSGGALGLICLGMGLLTEFVKGKSKRL